MAVLRIESRTYPAGGEFRTVYCDKTRLGNYDVVEGGFLPQGCRKVIAKESAAQVKVINRYVTARLGEAAKASSLFEQFNAADI
jgi:hypothetical protein